MSTPKKFLNLFEYERKEKNANNNATVFINCHLLRDLEGLKKGSTVQSIIINMNFLIWEDNDLVDEVSIYY